MCPNKFLNTDSKKLPSLKKSRFTEILIKENALGQSEFEGWIFCHGMLFNSPDKWWGDHGRRDFPHEGIDFCLYEDRSQNIRRLDENTRIPLMHDGVVKAIFKDYLGQAIIIDHENADSGIDRFISMYAHTKPLPGIQVGNIVKEGDIIATIADTRNSKANIIPHLHFSIGLPSRKFSYERFVFNKIRDPEMVILFDPLTFIDGPYQELDAANSACREL